LFDADQSGVTQLIDARLDREHRRQRHLDELEVSGSSSRFTLMPPSCFSICMMMVACGRTVRRSRLRANRRDPRNFGWPHATIIMQIEKQDGGIKVKRELEAGYFQSSRCPLPAVLSIQSGINKLRYATLIGIKQAKNKPLRKVALAEVQSALGEKPTQDREAVHSTKEQENRMLEGSPSEVAKKLVEKTAQRRARAVKCDRTPRRRGMVLMHLDEKERRTTTSNRPRRRQRCSLDGDRRSPLDQRFDRVFWLLVFTTYASGIGLF